MHSVLVKDTLFLSFYEGHLQDLVILFDLHPHLFALDVSIVRCLEATFTMRSCDLVTALNDRDRLSRLAI